MSATGSVPARSGLRPASASPDVRWAVGLALLALVLRLAFVLAFGRTKLAFNDTAFYHAVADSLAHGAGFEYFGHPTVHWPPGFPFVLAGVYRLFGAHVTAGLVLNALLGALTVALVYAIALRAAGR